ncbi:hypothetical protein [Leeuwenhoekiella nanhaiensis]|uniref:hypothetical protein n=1 Tax=Leeuwenhoekiella nanhaiensis TaxID=1655491 RepID=UPI001670E67D|nr:hypothetical protein [Leeuwenhoekiella nanhaiensis]
MRLQLSLLLVLAIGVSSLKAQKLESKGFKDYFPIAERPFLAGGSGNNAYESILLEAKPVVYYSIYNDIRSALNRDTITNGDAVYLSIQPHLRIYDENSKPVKTPSYKFFIGWQSIIKTENDNFLTAALESGHYSNGQSKSAFSTDFADNSPESRALYDDITDDTDLAALLNRESGNFSTNLTRLSLNYRINTFDARNYMQKAHSFTLTYQLYHNRFLGAFNFGGYNPEDIDIYGRHQVEAGYEYTAHFNSWRYSVTQRLYWHPDVHPSADPFRSETSFSLYPWDSDFGLMARFVFGYDDYNYRFVDSYPRFSVGFTWDWFTPFVIKPTKLQVEEN